MGITVQFQSRHAGCSDSTGMSKIEFWFKVHLLNRVFEYVYHQSTILKQII